jgi:hypothetical protein
MPEGALVKGAEQGRHDQQARGGRPLEASSPILSIAMAVAAFAAVAGVTAGVRNVRAWGPKGRAVGHGLVGLAASSLVFLLQSVSVGASVGGAVLALAIGGMAVLVLMLVRST